MNATASRRLRVGVLVSGRGSNLQAILDSGAAGRLTSAEVVLVISNRSDAQALKRAAHHGVPIATIPRKDYDSRSAQHAAIAARMKEAGVELVVSAGFNRILDPCLLAAFPDRVINIHPSLLPAFAGTLHAQADAVAYGVKVAGCTVHFVDSSVDGGAIIAQTAVPVADDDTADSLADRILGAEHDLLPRVIQWFGEGRVARNGRHVSIEPVSSDSGADQAPAAPSHPKASAHV